MFRVRTNPTKYLHKKEEESSHSLMSLTKAIVQRFFSVSRINQPGLRNFCISSPAPCFPPAMLEKSPDPPDGEISRRYLQAAEQKSAEARSMEISRQRMELDGLRSLAAEESPRGWVTVADVKKVLRLSQLEKVKSRLREIEKSSVSYTEFLQICDEDNGLNDDQSSELAKILEKSGIVIVLGSTVFLKPEQVTKAIQSLIIPVPMSSQSSSDARMKELEEMELHKAAIDKNAESQVRRELRLGLGSLIVQTTVLMKLTFWDLSWDVMEPICFFVTSLYCIGSYAFFLTTSNEPTFEGFFRTRFIARQKRLMEIQNFDVERYNELKKGSV